MGVVVLLAGVVVAIVGGIGLHSANAAQEHERRVGAFSTALGGDNSYAVTQAVSAGHLWLGVLIFGLALVLVGIVVAALRKPAVVETKPTGTVWS